MEENCFDSFVVYYMDFIAFYYSGNSVDFPLWVDSFGEFAVGVVGNIFVEADFLKESFFDYVDKLDFDCYLVEEFYTVHCYSYYYLYVELIFLIITLIFELIITFFVLLFIFSLLII